MRGGLLDSSAENDGPELRNHERHFHGDEGDHTRNKILFELRVHAIVSLHVINAVP